MAAKTKRSAPGNAKMPMQREAWILGQPPLQKYLDFMEEIAPLKSAPSRKALIDDWRRANDHYYKLEVAEDGIADKAGIAPLAASLRGLARKVKADPRYKRSFDDLPTRFAMVELDRLIVPQPHVNLDHIARLKLRLGPKRTPAALFHFCLPLDRSEADVQMRRAGANRYLFWSPSSDFRFQEPVVLTPDQIRGYQAFGPIGSVIGLTVGFGSNFLTVIKSDGRLLLHNGHHRAYALRDLGVTHAPCIVQTVTRRDELNLVASRAVRDDPAFYFKSARPPLLKDFFDPKLRKVISVPPLTRVVELSFDVKEFEIKDFRDGQ